MAISQKSIKILWANAGGRCSFEGCPERLCGQEAAGRAPYTLGQMAHIKGDKPGSSRHDPAQDAAERDDYQNLILLCPTHHTLIDRSENESVYTVEVLHAMKAEHEAGILARLDQAETPNKQVVAQEIVGLLEQNRQSWAQFGPQSELARSQPFSEEAYEVWVSERLSVIVPNNRKIAAAVAENEAVFALSDLEVLESFSLHARSYERWVRDEIPYAAVVRFPPAFDAFIREMANGGA